MANLGSLTVSFRLEWITTDPTGEKCDACGEIPWLRAERLRVHVEPLTAKARVAVEHPDLYLCPDCAEQIRENPPPPITLDFGADRSTPP